MRHPGADARTATGPRGDSIDAGCGSCHGSISPASRKSVGVDWSRALDWKSGSASVSQATRIATEGGRHSGFLRQAVQRTESQLRSSIRSFETKARQHVDYLRDPAKAVSEKGGDWSKMSEQAREGLVKHWNKEVDNFRAQAEIARDVLKSR